MDAPADIVALDCNCSICSKAGYLHLIVPLARFRLLRGEEALTEYRFNSGAARHLFCSRCGVKSFYVPRSNPDGIDVNVRCLDGKTITSLRITPYDGRNWEDAVADIVHLSRE